MSGDGGSIQGGEPQGADEGGDDFVTSYLNNVPEDYRPHVEPYLRDIESNANERFREHAEYKQQWEPYEGLNLNEYDPEGLQELISFAEQMSDPQQFQQWWQETGQRAGFFDGLNVEDDIDDDDILDDDGNIDVDTVAQVVAQVLDERLGPIEQGEQERQQQQLIQEANQSIDTEMQQLADEYNEGEPFDEKTANTIYRLAFALSETSETPIRDAFNDFMQLRADIENETVNGKVSVPSPPQSGVGPANTNAQAPTTFADAKAMARERLAAQNG